VDAKEPSTTVCRSVADICDVAENCTGSADACPADAFKASTIVCRATAGICDTVENCTGTGSACPADAVEPTTTECRSVAGICDVAENCDGTLVTCPADTYESTTVVCRNVAGICDVSESCTGSGPNCPADSFESSTVVCRAQGGVCDIAENCTGGAAACPGDLVEPATTVCRPAATTGDAPESCDAVSYFCPADAFLPLGTLCDDGDYCTQQSEADGFGACVGFDPVDCDDLNPCTDEVCDSQAGGFLCLYSNNGTCVGPNCGNAVVDAGETCDPPNLAPGPNGQPLCRLDCTSCGDGVIQANNVETCDDGNTVSGCQPDKPQLPLDNCLNNCNEPICADPARIKFGTNGRPDQFTFHSRLISDPLVDFASNHFVIELVDSTDVVLYRSSLVSGSLEVQSTTTVRYKNNAARDLGGFSKIKLKRGKGYYVVSLRAYGDLSAAVADMRTHVYVGSDEWVVRGQWKAVSDKGWKLSNKDALLPVP
jgi:cysteine-rich repeat protein